MFGAPPPVPNPSALSAEELREAFREFDLDKNGCATPATILSRALAAGALVCLVPLSALGG